MRALILIFLLSCDPPAGSRCYDSAIVVPADSKLSKKIVCNSTATAGFAETPQGVVLLCTCPKDAPSAGTPTLSAAEAR